MKLSDIGERNLLEMARMTFRCGPHVRVGIGDDAAAIDIGDMCLVATTDMLVASVHFPSGTKPEQIGRKAVVVNLSDLAAMGAKPTGLVFSVALPRETDVNFAKRLMEGMDDAAHEYGTYVVGGDLDESKDITIAGTAFGLASKGNLLRRAGAKAGDIVAVTGNLGAASAGIKLLLEKLPVNGYRALIKAQLEPKARVREGMALAKTGKVKAAMDVTDGLALSLWEIARESKVKITIDRERIPIHPLAKKFASQHGFNIDDFALFGGEDFELLFTTRPRSWAKIGQALKRVGAAATPFGRVTKGRGVFIRDGVKTRLLEKRGYEHFK